MKKSILISLSVIVILFLAAYFIWPTPYVKEDLNLGMFGIQTVRTNRFSGEKQIRGSGKWQKIEISADGNISFPAGTTVDIR